VPLICGGTIINRAAKHCTLEFIQQLTFISVNKIKMQINDALTLCHIFRLRGWQGVLSVRSAAVAPNHVEPLYVPE
jgi:hypothetical protein